MLTCYTDNLEDGQRTRAVCFLKGFCDRKQADDVEPIHFQFVLDTSGSMSMNVAGSGISRLDLVLRAIKYLIKRRQTCGNSADTISIIGFNNSATCYIQPTTLSDVVIQQFMDDIKAEGQTNIVAGLVLGLATIANNVPPTTKAMMFFLTDGRVNAGECRDDVIIANWKHNVAELNNMRSTNLVFAALGISKCANTRLVAGLATCIAPHSMFQVIHNIEFMAFGKEFGNIFGMVQSMVEYEVQWHQVKPQRYNWFTSPALPKLGTATVNHRVPALIDQWSYDRLEIDELAGVSSSLVMARVDVPTENTTTQQNNDICFLIDLLHTDLDFDYDAHASLPLPLGPLPLKQKNDTQLPIESTYEFKDVIELSAPEPPSPFELHEIKMTTLKTRVEGICLLRYAKYDASLFQYLNDVKLLAIKKIDLATWEFPPLTFPCDHGLLRQASLNSQACQDASQACADDIMVQRP